MSILDLNDAPGQGIELNLNLSDVGCHIPYEEDDDFPGYPKTQPVQQPVPPTQPTQQTQTAQQSQPQNEFESRMQGLNQIGRYKFLQKISDEDLERHLYLLQEKYNLKNECCFASSLQGPAPQEEYLVDGTFSMAKGHLFAADGGLGKGMLLLELAANVASENPPLLATFCGRSIFQFNKKAVIIAGEDSMDDFHRRIESMGLQKSSNLRLVALPDKAGGSSLFYPEPNGRYKIGALWKVLANQICEMRPALVVIDPLSALVEIDSDKDNNGISFATKHIAALANESGACIIVSSHTRKGDANNKGKRENIKGVVALINGLRSASLMWEPDIIKASKICKEIGEEYEPEKIVFFRSVKNNSSYNKRQEVLKREKNGRLICITDYWKHGCTPERAEELLIYTIKYAAECSCPYKATGEDGLYKQRGSLPQPLNKWSKNALEKKINELIEEGKIVKGSQVGKSQKCWLDVPDGPVARGEFTEVKPGSRFYGDHDGNTNLTDINEILAAAEAAAAAETESETDSGTDTDDD